MNIVLLLLSLLSPYLSPSPQKEEAQTALFPIESSIMLAFEHSVSFTPSFSSLDSLAGVSLYMSKEELLLTKGTPLDIAADPWQNCLEYKYADMSAGVCEGTVLYVHVTPSQAGTYGLRLNDEELEPVKNNFNELLGTPDFAAEDGDVYIRGSAALKVYRNSQTGEWDGIDLFDANSS